MGGIQGGSFSTGSAACVSKPARGRSLTGLEMLVLESTLYLERELNQCGAELVEESLEKGLCFESW